MWAYIDVGICGRDSGFYPYTWWAQLAPSEKLGAGSLDKVVDQNVPPIFNEQTTPLTKLPLSIFLFLPIFNLHP